jgi:integrase
VADVWKRKGRKSKPWVADYLDANGLRRRLAAATKEEAQAHLVEKTRESREIGPTASDREITVKAYSAIWFRRTEQDWKFSTRKAYAYALRTHILPAFGNVRVRDLSKPHVKFFLDEKQEAKLSRATITHLRAVLSSMLSEAVDDGLVARNVAFSVRRKKRTTQGQSDPTGNIRPLSETEVEALLDATLDHQDRTLFMLLVRAGLRPGEALALQWTDFDFSARQILVERALFDGHLDSPKGGRSRQVDMSQMLASSLSSLYREREREKLAGEWDEIPDWVFCRQSGEPLRLEKIRYRFERSLRRAGVSGHVLYDLRHSFASTLLAKGAPITYVAQQMGHANANITLKYYARWIPSPDRSFVDALDRPGLAPLSGTTQEKPKYSQENLAESNVLVS